ncbi:unnamed protein product [Durusdinium trenchii]|uniref:Uncharacterized protein n=1 Tax=Durusdinium trenchii TaxID=1381693 RepID=A0ABP0L6S6_9DINO
MPVILASKRGVIKAAIIKGDAPLLLSRSALKALGATLNFEKDCLHVFQQVVPLKTNSAGQYIVHLVGQPADPVFAASFDEVMASVEAPDVEPESNTAPPDSAGTTASVPADEIACEPDPAVKTCLAVHARKLVEEDLITDPPELLVLCPPCTDESGWVYGLRLPSSEHYIRKSTRLLVSHSDMQSLGLLCTGDAKHSCHDTVAGHAPGVAKVGMDVKHLKGWLPNQKIRAVNLVDTASGFQRMIPFFETETASDLLNEPQSVIASTAALTDEGHFVLPCWPDPAQALLSNLGT